jgi:hypothetical protein
MSRDERDFALWARGIMNFFSPYAHYRKAIIQGHSTAMKKFF